MIEDPYSITSQIANVRRYSNMTFDKFIKFATVFYDKTQKGYHPSITRQICDPYGWALLCNDYQDEDFPLNMEASCKDIFEKKCEGDGSTSDLIGALDFKTILNLIYRGFWFNYDLAMELYMMQNSPLSIFKQILGGRGYIFNRFKPDLVESQKYLKFASESILYPDEKLRIPVPHIYRVCDGLNWPVICMNYTGPYRVVKGECGGFGDGLFIVDYDYMIIDVLRVNDLWLTDTGLENRLRFANTCKEYDTRSFVKCWSLRSSLEAGKMLNANPDDGLLLRSCAENFYKNYWFRWYEGSLIYYKRTQKGKLTTQTKAKPNWYKLTGEDGTVDDFEYRRYDRVFLDEWDVKEFQKILTI